MKSFRLFCSLSGLALLATGLGGCLQAPDYSTTPSISNNNVRVSSFKSTVPGGQSIDSVYITINYQDGDGDLGLSGDESKVAPYTYPSLFNNNYFIEPTVKYVGTTTYVVPILQYNNTPAAPGTFNARFDHITGLTDSKTAPIKGTLTRTFAFGRGDYFNAGDVVRFDVSIADRALHVSNVIRTDSIVIPKL
ncbi:hypothetical protein [Hymenobacter psoromatis]|uniref:hypothetical protein n=1 Tax=Hymenobacter psoromatis TaxID=1484116 RepID=UPI001CBBC065|nr:hypothetical protein [Hymenobacter psoromatis]